MKNMLNMYSGQKVFSSLEDKSGSVIVLPQSILLLSLGCSKSLILEANDGTFRVSKHANIMYIYIVSKGEFG
jgi:hypothetical protein